MLGKEEPSFSPTSTRANSPTYPTPGGHSSSATHPNKGWKEPRQRVRESSHGHSGGEERQLEPPQLQFSVGISPGSQVEGYLHPHRAHSVCSGRGCHRWSRLVACGTHRQRGGSCQSPGPGRWMLCSSLQLFLQPGSERCEALWESSDSKNSFC